MPARTTRPKTRSADAPLYQLKFTLKWSRPAIWRRVVVRSDLTLDRLDAVIQTAMGWTNSHLHQFITTAGRERTCYGVPDPSFGGMDGGTLNERQYTVADLASAVKGKFVYEYDFGDSWEHDVFVEKILPLDPSFQHPICLKGAGACPPEDCGGLPGYYRLLEIMSDPKHPEHEEIMDWTGGEIDAAAFSLDAVNAGLKRIKA